MDWKTIKDLAMSMCGNPQSVGGAEIYVHLTEGQRRVSSRLKLASTESIDHEVATTASQDYVDEPAGLHSVIHVFEKESGQEIIPEEHGIRGRARYFDSETGMPPEGGPPERYVRSNGKIYLRPTPDSADYTIVIRGKESLGAIDETMLASESVIPAEYHYSIATATAISFLRAHPLVLNELPDGHVDSLETSFKQGIQLPELPKDNERFDQRGRVRMRGFRRGRR